MELNITPRPVVIPSSQICVASIAHAAQYFPDVVLSVSSVSFYDVGNNDTILPVVVELIGRIIGSSGVLPQVLSGSADVRPARRSATNIRSPVVMMPVVQDG